MPAMADTDPDFNRLAGDVYLQIAKTWDGYSVATSDIVDVSVRLDNEGFAFHVAAPFYGDPAPSAPVGELDGLWEYEVVELFLLGAGDHYLEIELGPHGHYLILLLDGIRQVKKRLQPRHCASRISGSCWQATLTVAIDQLPLPITHVNAYAIHGHGVKRRYLAAFPVPGEKPDFHQPQFFAALSTLL